MSLFDCSVDLYRERADREVDGRWVNLLVEYFVVFVAVFVFPIKYGSRGIRRLGHSRVISLFNVDPGLVTVSPRDVLQ